VSAVSSWKSVFEPENFDWAIMTYEKGAEKNQHCCAVAAVMAFISQECECKL